MVVSIERWSLALHVNESHHLGRLFLLKSPKCAALDVSIFSLFAAGVSLYRASGVCAAVNAGLSPFVYMY